MVLVGRLTKDAVVNQLKDERKVVNFTIAVNDYYKPKNSDRGITVAIFINCAYWASPKLAEWLKKGTLVELTGRLSFNTYKDMEGDARGSLTCHVDSIKIHQRIKSDAVTRSKKNEAVIDDLPF